MATMSARIASRDRERIPASCHPGHTGGSPEVWVSRCRAVIRRRSGLVRKAGSSAAIGSSMASVPSSASDSTVMAVNTLVIDARS
ncbi:hypothetical protein MAJHIDBO_02273 [Propionibacterium freudenreichii subsp. shermanii]|nr:hypothetical protein MAJHIDBO_02273 [Propionibacterium freudenreichii subsp. shermanii]SPS10054.1 hypothetical protein MAJHIDBO_02273 [Propionibacterium freudenreichii subsp. shermanii]